MVRLPYASVSWIRFDGFVSALNTVGTPGDRVAKLIHRVWLCKGHVPIIEGIDNSRNCAARSCARQVPPGKRWVVAPGLPMRTAVLAVAQVRQAVVRTREFAP